MRLYSVPFSYSDVEQHICLLKDEVNRSSAKDCVINTMYFMKMFKRGDAEMYARIIHDEKMPGLTQQQIIDLVFRKFTSISKTQDAIIKIKQLSLNELKELMEPNTCTYVSFFYRDLTMRHAVVIFKNKHGDLGIYDGQTQNLVNTKEGMKNWFELYSPENLEVLYESDKRIRISGRKDEKPPLKRIRKETHEKPKSNSVKYKPVSKSKPSKSKTKSKTKSKSKTDAVVDVLLEKPLTEKEKETKYNLEIEPVVQDENKKIKTQTRKKHRFVKKAIKQTGLEKNRQLRFSQKIMNDQKKRENLLKINRQQQQQQSETVSSV